jgi:hypothetical protein
MKLKRWQCGDCVTVRCCMSSNKASERSAGCCHHTIAFFASSGAAPSLLLMPSHVNRCELQHVRTLRTRGAEGSTGSLPSRPHLSSSFSPAHSTLCVQVTCDGMAATAGR